jgi:hypothetical protein
LRRVTLNVYKRERERGERERERDHMSAVCIFYILRGWRFVRVDGELLLLSFFNEQTGRERERERERER